MVSKEATFLIDTILKRIDFYINATNLKAAIIITINTFILGSIVLKYDILIGNISNKNSESIIIGLSIIAMIGNIISIYFILNAILPFVKTGNKPGNYHSLIYYESIAEMEESDYLKNFRNWVEDDSKVEEDILRQCHILSKGLKEKHNQIKISMQFLLFGVLLPLVLITLIRFINFLVS